MPKEYYEIDPIISAIQFWFSTSFSMLTSIQCPKLLNFYSRNLPVDQIIIKLNNLDSSVLGKPFFSLANIIEQADPSSETF
jgi:hypothetical protein